MKMIEIVLSRSPVCIEKMQLVFCRLLKSEYWRTFWIKYQYRSSRLPGFLWFDRCCYLCWNMMKSHGTDRRREASTCMDAVFFSSCRLPKTLSVTTLLLLGPVILLCGFMCGSFLSFIWRVMDPFSYQTVNTVGLTHLRSVLPIFQFTWTPEADQSRSKPCPICNFQADAGAACRRMIPTMKGQYERG